MSPTNESTTNITENVIEPKSRPKNSERRRTLGGVYNVLRYNTNLYEGGRWMSPGNRRKEKREKGEEETDRMSCVN
jgi:hypothetical protein